MKQPKSLFVCTECDAQSSKWLGRCPTCGAWNTFEEVPIVQETPRKNTAQAGYSDVRAVSFSSVGLPEYIRAATGISELDRVLGGGLVAGSVVLLSGEPGIGKSTLLMQLSGAVADNSMRRVLYVSGEESQGQLKLRAERLKITGDGIYMLTDGDIDNIIKEANEIKPSIIIADSVQTLTDSRLTSAAGSVTQVRETAARLIAMAKSDGVAVILVGHINKEGSIAGPKILEHMVDAVLYFEGERRYAHRIIRAIKNRFGSTNEIGVFEMTETGLNEVTNPSEMLLRDRPIGVSGNCAVCVMEGSRPIIAEIQALATPTVFPSPRRTANGADYNRMCLLLAVLEKRLGLRFSTQDIYLNVVGGLHIDEPAADLASAMAMISSLLDRPLPDDMIAVGEIGLAGECRAVSDMEQRVREAGRLGFSRVVLPSRSADKLRSAGRIKLIPLKSIYEAIALLDKK
ncbi:MAG: DNA repair protein RadA [Eubacteriales bacterium]